MKVLENLEPKSVFGFFEELCAIPHGSRNTREISDYLVRFAKERGLEHYQDELNNVIIIAPATPGYENAEPVIIQGHMDMVCEKAPDCEKDMAREGLDLAVEGDCIFARGTTLGGDDGIAVAMALAVLDSDTLPHPRVEAVITVDEEIGMEGAAGIDLSPLKARRLINVDSEEEGIFTVGCAGGACTECTLPITREASDGVALDITVTGLLGGHSGAEIDKGRANADMLMGRVLYAMSKACELRLVSVNGGLKDNAIPTAAYASVIVADTDAAKRVCREMEAQFKNEYRVNDGGISVSVSEGKSASASAMDKASSTKCITLLTCVPNGIQAMSADIPGLVQTSLNLGILTTDDDKLTAAFSVRSSIASQKRMLIDRLTALTEQLGGTVSVSGDYPGWEFDPDSKLRALMAEVFTEQYGHEPVVGAIHAGLECGLLIEKLPGLDCVSIGPDIDEIHTFREKLHIASTGRTWKLLTETLKRMK